VSLPCCVFSECVKQEPIFSTEDDGVNDIGQARFILFIMQGKSRLTEIIFNRISIYTFNILIVRCQKYQKKVKIIFCALPGTADELLKTTTRSVIFLVICEFTPKTDFTV